MIKKVIALITVLVMSVCLVSCGKENVSPDQVIVAGSGNTVGIDSVFTVKVNGTEVVLGMEMTEELAAKASSVFEVGSCALEGTDFIYTFGGCEVTAFSADGEKKVIHSVYFTNTEMATAEGLCLGDDQERVTELYGDDVDLSTGFVMLTKGASTLTIMVENGAVISIEYGFELA